MQDKRHPILVFGATGQQGGSVATALLKAGWPVRAFVRDPASLKAAALRAAGAELLRGTFEDVSSIRVAMNGAHGVFSVQPSSPGGTITDEDEVRFGISIAALAVESNVRHLVYSSGGAVGEKPTGLAHFDTKGRIEAHIRTLPITATIIRPAAFMELLVMPGFGLNEHRFNFFLRPDQSMQVLAVEDIGKFVAAIFADTDRFGRETFEIASDTISGRDLETMFTKAAGRTIAYERFSDAVLAGNPFLAKLTALLDAGPLAGRADLAMLREINPDILSFKTWLEGSGREAFQRALGMAGAWEYNS